MPPRLDFVSPLPPVRSGIADYSADLLPHLAALADVRLIELPGQPPAAAAEGEHAGWPFAAGCTRAPANALDAPRSWEGEDAEGSGAADAEGGGSPRLPLYQMGNNRHHEVVLELALRHPGVVTLHDVVLHHLLLDVTLGRGDFYGYRERLGRDHGWIGEAVAVAKRWGAYGTAPIFALPAHRTLLARQRGVLVHSAWAAGVVREEVPGLPPGAVRAVPMGVPLPPPAARHAAAGRELRRRCGIPEGVPVVGSFGFQTPIKRTSLGIAALAAPGLEGVHLLVVGEESVGSDLLAQAHRAGVAERVHITGYLPFADLAAAIAAADLCLNLRYPTAGETSASLLRVMAAGRPAIVSDYAQFAELPDAIAVKVPLAAHLAPAAAAGLASGPFPAGGEEQEAAALAAALAALLGQRERLERMGAAAREHVRTEHDPRRAAAAIAAACAEWAAASPRQSPGPAEGPEPPPSSLACSRLPGELLVRGAELPWREGERRRLEIVLRNRGTARWLAGGRGPGGVALVVKLLAGGRDLLAHRPWLPLPRDLAPGEEASWRIEVRRPPGPPAPPWPPGVSRMPIDPERIRLWIEPHLFGGLGLSRLGGPRWERDL